MVQCHYENITFQQLLGLTNPNTVLVQTKSRFINLIIICVFISRFALWFASSFRSKIVVTISGFVKYNILEKMPALFTAITWNFLHGLDSCSSLLRALPNTVSATSARWYSLLLSVQKYWVSNSTISFSFWNHESLVTIS